MSTVSIATPVEEILPKPERDRVRNSWMAEPGFYSPWLHLGTTTFLGAALGGLGLSVVHSVRWWEVAFGVAIYVLANATEWRIHRDALHHRLRIFPAIYDRHTPHHHMVFIADDFALRNRSEWRMVLIPPYAIALLFVGLTPLMAALWAGGFRNLAGIFAFVTMVYVVGYEWFHLALHSPETSFLGRSRLMATFRRHHQIHHDPRLMQRWNFNVCLPLWDLVRRTYVHSIEDGLSRQRVPVTHDLPSLKETRP